MNSSANVPATHKVRKGIAAVIINAVRAYFLPFLYFPYRVDDVFLTEGKTSI